MFFFLLNLTNVMSDMLTMFYKTKIRSCLIKNGPRYNLAIDDPNKEKYTGNEMALKTLQT
jgi:hypothetical protein